LDDCEASAERHLIPASDASNALAIGVVELVGIIGCLSAMVSSAAGLSSARAVPAEAEVSDVGESQEALRGEATAEENETEGEEAEDEEEAAEQESELSDKEPAVPPSKARRSASAIMSGEDGAAPR
jgi:hypothetical protein